MNIKKMLPYLILMCISFYLFPILIQNTGMGMLILLIFMPLICFVCSFLFGLKHSFQPLFSILLSVLFIPSIFIYYNSSALIYALIYGLLSLLGLFLGAKSIRRN